MYYHNDCLGGRIDHLEAVQHNIHVARFYRNENCDFHVTTQVVVTETVDTVEFLADRNEVRRSMSCAKDLCCMVDHG